MQWLRNLIPIPVWASLLANVGWVWMTTPQHTFTGVTHSHLLGGIATSGSRLPPSLPCTPTFDNQSPAVGRCCLSTTVRVGVAPTWTLSCQRTNLLFAAQPLYLRIVSSERVAPSRSSRPAFAPLRRAAERGRWQWRFPISLHVAHPIVVPGVQCDTEQSCVTSH
jgi:hypothetical protein